MFKITIMFHRDIFFKVLNLLFLNASHLHFSKNDNTILTVGFQWWHEMRPVKTQDPYEGQEQEIQTS